MAGQEPSKATGVTELWDDTHIPKGLAATADTYLSKPGAGQHLGLYPHQARDPHQAGGDNVAALKQKPAQPHPSTQHLNFRASTSASEGEQQATDRLLQPAAGLHLPLPVPAPPPPAAPAGAMLSAVWAFHCHQLCNRALRGLHTQAALRRGKERLALHRWVRGRGGAQAYACGRGWGREQVCVCVCVCEGGRCWGVNTVSYSCRWWWPAIMSIL